MPSCRPESAHPMTRIVPEIRANARRLRREMTPEERRLWGALRDLNRTRGTRFRRQAPIGRFILDFADLGLRLAVEVDGGQHALPDGAAVDALRDNWLRTQGFSVLRVWNADVWADLEGVMHVVTRAVDERTAQ